MLNVKEAAQLRFAKLHLQKSQDFWNNVLWQSNDITKTEFGHNAHTKYNISAQTPHTYCSHRTRTPCNYWVHRELLRIPKYSRVRCEAICATAKVWRKLAHQQDNDPKHSSKSTTECLTRKRIKVLQWSSQSPDLNLTEMLWWDLKRAVHKRMPMIIN